MQSKLMQRGSLVHWRRKLRTDGIKIRYRIQRLSALIDAIPGGVIFSDEQVDGDAEIQIKAPSFLILPTDLVLAGMRREPAAGHWIQIPDVDANQNLDFVGEEFDVRSGPSGSAWDWSDGHRWFWRVHAIRRRGADSVPSN